MLALFLVLTAKYVFIAKKWFRFQSIFLST